MYHIDVFTTKAGQVKISSTNDSSLIDTFVIYLKKNITLQKTKIAYIVYQYINLLDLVFKTLNVQSLPSLLSSP